MKSATGLFGVAIVFVAALGLLLLRDRPGVLQILAALVMFALAVAAGIAQSGGSRKRHGRRRHTPMP